MNKKILTGIDLVCLTKFSRVLTNPKFVTRIFHANEIGYCEKKKNPIPSFAARFAAKEAFSKALGTGLYSQKVFPQCVWIENETGGRPLLCFSPEIRLMMEKQSIMDYDVSLSHHGNYAIATVTLLRGENQEKT